MNKKDLKKELAKAGIEWDGSNYKELCGWWDSTACGTACGGFGIALLFEKLGWVYRSGDGKWRRI